MTAPISPAAAPAVYGNCRLRGPVTIKAPRRRDRAATVGELCTRFLEDYADARYRKANGVPTGHYVNMRHAVRAVEFTRVALDSPEGATGQDADGSHVRALWQLDPNQFQPDDLRAVIQVMVDAGLRLDTINNRIGRIRQVFRWATGQGLLANGVIAGLDAVERLEPGRCEAKAPIGRQAVSDEVFFATVDAARECGEHALVALMLMQYHTGMRSSELMQMTAGMIDQSRSPWVYEVPRVAADTPAEVKGHKSDRRKHRYVPLFDSARQLLAGRIQYAMPFVREKPIFRNGSRAWTPNSYRTKLVRICERRGIKPWTPHDLRRSFATRMEARYGLHTAQILLGHSCPKTTDGYVTRDLMALFAKVESGAAA